MKRLLILALLTASASATTINAASCSNADVVTAIGTAVTGDTVVIPAGTCTYTSTLTVTLAINLLGAGEGVTTLIDGVDKSNCGNHPALFMNIASNATWRLSAFTMQASAADPGQCAENIQVATNSHTMRVDHITWTNMTTTGITITGDPWGVVDHVTMNGDARRGVVIHHDAWAGVGAFGDNSWAQADTLGGAGAVYVEDSTFNITNAGSTGAVACDAYGARCVVRHSTLPFVGTHGTDSTGRPRSMRQLEIYNNTFNDVGTAVGQAMQQRGGTGIFFNNNLVPTVAGSYTGNGFALQIYREVDGFRPFGGAASPNFYYTTLRGSCDGTSPFDTNDGVTYDSGTHSGASGGINLLTDGTKSWTVNQWQGYSLHNDTTGPWGASISSNTATTITTYNQTQGTGAHTWNAGDGYRVLKVYPCMDQLGRGQGDYISGGSNTVAPTPSGALHQALDPIYAWGNSKNSVAANIIGTPSYSHIVANRDYYDENFSFTGATGVGQGLLASRPATCTPLVAYWATDNNNLYQCSTTNTWTSYYTPYVYPHPLQNVVHAVMQGVTQMSGSTVMK